MFITTKDTHQRTLTLEVHLVEIVWPVGLCTVALFTESRSRHERGRHGREQPVRRRGPEHEVGEASNVGAEHVSRAGNIALIFAMIPFANLLLKVQVNRVIWYNWKWLG